MRGEDDATVATLKGDARLAEVLRRALWSHVRVPSEGLVVPRGARRWRVAAYEAEELVASLRERGVRYGAARAMVPQSLAHRILVAMENAGDSPDDRVQDAVARSKPVKDYANQVWPAVAPARLVWRLLSDPAFLAEAADGVLDEDEQALVRWAKPPRSPGTARWSLADAVLLDEAADLVERTPSLAHIVADEAQDLSPMMLRALARRSSTGSLTVLGDLAQATTPWATRSWAEALGHLGKPDAHVEQLTRGFRVPGEVIEYAARLLPHIAPDLEPPTSVRRSRGELAVVSGPTLLEVVRTAIAREGSVGLIVPDATVAAAGAELRAAGIGFALLGEEPATEGVETEFDQHLDLVPATLAKGLEFDHVVLVEPAAIVAGEPTRVTGLRRLYVCLTRAVTSLVVLHREPLPPELGSWRSRAMDVTDSWPLAGGAELRDLLVAAYSDPARGYHDLRHLTEVCARLDELAAGGVDFERTPVLLAAWFHDGVYDGQPGAEERSAQWAETALPGLAVPAPVVAEVARLVRLTETHRPSDDDPHGCALSDADLAILAAPRARYEEYAADVRREYAHVPDDQFRAGRAAILRDLLAKPHLFHTAYARESWEAAARANVERELVALERRPSRRLAPQAHQWVSLPVSSAVRADTAADHEHARGSAAALAPPQPGDGQPAHQLARGDRLGTGGDDLVVPLGGHVVVVPVEAALGDAERPGEDVQLVVVGVAGQVRPEPAVASGVRRVDQDRHPAEPTARPTALSTSRRQERTWPAST